MAGAQNISKISIMLSANPSGLTVGLKSAEKKVTTFGMKVKAIGLGIGGAMGPSVGRFLTQAFINPIAAATIAFVGLGLAIGKAFRMLQNFVRAYMAIDVKKLFAGGKLSAGQGGQILVGQAGIKQLHEAWDRLGHTLAAQFGPTLAAITLMLERTVIAMQGLLPAIEGFLTGIAIMALPAGMFQQIMDGIKKAEEDAKRFALELQAMGKAAKKTAEAIRTYQGVGAAVRGSGGFSAALQGQHTRNEIERLRLDRSKVEILHHIEVNTRDGVRILPAFF